MKKIVLSLFLSIMAGIAINAANSLQSPETVLTTPQNSDSDKRGKHDKKIKKDSKKFHGKKQSNPFEGIELTEQQKNDIKNLQKTLSADRKKLTPEEEANLTEEQKKELKEAQKARRENYKKDYLSGLKNILTPDQYILFLENNYLQEGFQMRDNGHGPIKDIRTRPRPMDGKSQNQ